MTLINNRNIQHLDLTGSSLREEEVLMACEALRHPHCALESLRRVTRWGRLLLPGAQGLIVLLFILTYAFAESC